MWEFINRTSLWTPLSERENEMKKLCYLSCIAILLVACTSTSKPVKPEMISAVDLDETGGADAYASSGDHEDSMYYQHPDFYHMKSSENLTLLSNFKTMQQTTEYSCGNVTTLMGLYHLGITNYTEEQLAIGMKSSMDLDVENAGIGTADNYHEYGSDVSRMVPYLETLPEIKVVESSFRTYTIEDVLSKEDGVSENDFGNLPGTFSSMALYTSENSDTSEAYVEDAKDSYFVTWLLQHLQADHMVMVEWGDWDGHWMNIIGYDSMGTPNIGDDMLIFADPYDTGDHFQDGYAYYPLEKFFNMWKDRNVAPKPYQLQPYIVFAKAE